MMSKNYFLENNRTTSVMISKYRVNYQELHENTLDFSKIKLFVKLDGIDVTKKNRKEKKLNKYFSWSAFNSKYHWQS